MPAAPGPAINNAEVAARRWSVSGVVQGVGFRPFVYRLATAYGLDGWVKNCSGRVEVVGAGDPGRLDAFGRDLVEKAPLISRPRISSQEPRSADIPSGFAILPSDTESASDIHIPVDYFVCEDCLAELRDPEDRRYRYPFINCTQCGPRYTLIKSLPYDRASTSMAVFQLCNECLHEYQDPANRRFHAEPVACPVCGPRLHFKRNGSLITDTADALAACISALRDDLVVAVKGVGGYHLVCNATSYPSVQRLRDLKPRPHKPLAVLFPDTNDLALLRRNVELGHDEEKLLRSPERPVVLLTRRATCSVAENIAPGLAELGVMLPYSPLHHLLAQEIAAPLVVTSANLSGEPVLTCEHDVESQLSHVAQAFLHHNREIIRPADDPVYRMNAGSLRPIRLGRGNAPAELALPRKLDRPVLAVGAHMKNTICLAWDDRAVVSPHIGDMDAARSVAIFENVIADLQAAYDVQAEAIICDLHPGYPTTHWARRQGLPVITVQHHAAHASALCGEQLAGCDNDKLLIFTWDGVGAGLDGTLWGGESLLGCPGNWARVASMRPMRIPGAVRAGREPWRSAAAMAWEAGELDIARGVVERSVAETQRDDAYSVLHEAWERNINTHCSSAVGRLFDAAAALCGICQDASFEGQGPMWLEALVDGYAEPVAMPVCRDSDGVLRSDWGPLLNLMVDDGISLAERAAIFHASLADALLQQALTIREDNGVNSIGLTGGVFQNRRLTEACVERLDRNDFEILLAQKLPVNDAGISFGQVIEYAYHRDSKR